KGRIVGPGGAGAVFTINQTTANTQILNPSHHNVANLTGGGFVVVWTTTIGSRGLSGFETDAYLRVFDESGTAISDEILLSCLPGGSERRDVAALRDGGFVVIWQPTNGTSVLAQVFEAGGARRGGEHVVTTDAVDPAAGGASVSALTDGRIAVTWQQ